jgi:hypothetical protein
VSDLEPYIGVGEGRRRIAEDAIEAGEGIIILALLFIDYSKTKQDFIRFVEV